MLRTLGAGRKQVLAGVASEFAGTGAVAGLVAASTVVFLGLVFVVRLFFFFFCVFGFVCSDPDNI